jgi:flagellar biosynthesis protein FlhG
MKRKKNDLVGKIKELDVDIVILDLGAGTSVNMIDFFSLSDVKLIVTTLEPTSLMNNYEFLRNLIYRALYRLHRKDKKLVELLENFKQAKIKSMDTLLDSIDGWPKEITQNLCQNLKVFVVFNQVKKSIDANVGLSFKKVCQKYLSLSLEYPGFIFYNEEVVASVIKMLPLSLVNPDSITTKILRRIAILLMNHLSENQDLKEALYFAKNDFRLNSALQKKIARDQLVY